MYAFIEGKVCEKTGGMLVLLAGGVGYQLICSMNTLQLAPPIGETMRCMTYFSVREDAMELYGFASAEEKALFLKLIAVSGLKDYIVVDTDDVLMICPRDEHKVKDITTHIGMPEYEEYR